MQIVPQPAFFFFNLFFGYNYLRSVTLTSTYLPT